MDVLNVHKFPNKIWVVYFILAILKGPSSQANYKCHLPILEDGGRG